MIYLKRLWKLGLLHKEKVIHSKVKGKGSQMPELNLVSVAQNAESTATPLGWDASPLQGPPPPSIMSPVPIYASG